MHDIKSFIIFKLTEVANEKLIVIKSIKFIMFSRNIRDRKMKNTLFNVKYAFNLNNYIISTSIFDRKICFFY